MLMREHARFFFLSLLCLCTYVIGYGQQKTVRGTLLDNQNEPVAGASVIEKGTANGTSSDASGNFSLIVRPSAVLVISAVGFETSEVTVGDQTSLNLKLAPATTELGGVVVTALGISKAKRQLGYSVTELKGSDVAKTNEINPINALQGKLRACRSTRVQAERLVTPKS